MSKQPTSRPKKVAAPPRQTRGLKKSRESGVVRADVVLAPGKQVNRLALDIGRLIESARQQVAQAANAALTTLYWQIGTRIHQDVLKQRRAEYGAEIVATLGRQLEERFGRGFEEKNLRRMLQFAEAFPDSEIVAALRRQLGWSHFKLLIPMKDPLKREFYAEMCRAEGWSTRTLQQKIDSMLFERTALSRKPEQIIRKELSALRQGDQLSPDLVFQDPYLLDFLGLRDTFSEKDLESALLREIERFLLQLGAGFAFVERQKRITLDGDDYYIDLLFFHRRMRRLVVIELKIGEFKPADSGQVELYLRWLDRHERQPGEEAPVGIILCAGKKRETVEYLDLGERGIHVAEYLTELPPREVLRQRFHLALATARARVEQQRNAGDAKAAPAVDQESKRGR
jgi:predicted nuclease of restriction endonuclease-like (RecB) superfamily